MQSNGNKMGNRYLGKPKILESKQHLKIINLTPVGQEEVNQRAAREVSECSNDFYEDWS